MMKCLSEKVVIYVYLTICNVHLHSPEVFLSLLVLDIFA